MDENKKVVDLDQVFKLDAPDGEAVPEAQTEVKADEDKVPPEELEKPKVPYSRFENVSRARREAEAEAEKWRQRAIELEESKFAPQSQVGDVPMDWIKLYGDSAESREAWKIQSAREQNLLKQAEDRAFERLQGAQQREQMAIRDNLETIDEGLENLSAFVGRDLTDEEQSDVLDIVDEYTPKDDDGNYLGATIPFDKAWEIYELKQASEKAPTRKSRDNAARVINQPSNGQPSPEQKARDEAWMPGWNRWADRLPKEQ